MNIIALQAATEAKRARDLVRGLLIKELEKMPGLSPEVFALLAADAQAGVALAAALSGEE